MILLPLINELKIITKNRGLVRFGDVMNHGQYDLIRTCERQLATQGFIRIIVLKARQVGISTAIEAVLFAMATILDYFQCLVMSHEKPSAEWILRMTRNYWKTFTFADYYEEEYNGRTYLTWRNTGSGLHVATARNVAAGRSFTMQALHASEAAKYDKPDELMTGLRSSIPDEGITAIFIESTANGIGNYYHRTWVDADRGVNEFENLFYPWYKHPQYTMEFRPEKQREQYKLDLLDNEEIQLRQMGISDDKLMWRRWAIINLCHGDIDEFHQEYPTTPHEAFLSSGRNVFYLPHLLRHYQPWLGERGVLVEIKSRIEFVPRGDGWLTKFRDPATDQYGYQDREWGHYQIGADPTHTNAGDYACGQIFNRRTLEQVAVYRRKCDPLQFGKDLYLVGRYYYDARIAPEKEGPGYSTVGQLNGMGYPNIWEQTEALAQIDKTPGKGSAGLFGWGTNVNTKHLAITHVQHHLSQRVQQIGDTTYGLLIHDKDTFEEMRDYITSEDGLKYENGQGNPYDDTVSATCIAVCTSDLDSTPPPYEQPRHDPYQNLQVVEEGHVPVSVTVAPAKSTVEHSHEDPNELVPTESARKGAPWEDWEDDELLGER